MTLTRERMSQTPAHPAARRPDLPHRILFVKLGSFSHTNERVIEQLNAHFPDCEVVTFDAKDYIKRKFGLTALNALVEVMTYGPSVLSSKSARHAFFFLTPLMFRHLSAAIVSRFGPEASSFRFVLQTQGLFNAALPGRPFVIYTDHTVASHREYQHSDPRLFRSKALLRLERELYLRADRILTTAAHVERTLVRAYGCDPKRVATILIGANVKGRNVSEVQQELAAGVKQLNLPPDVQVSFVGFASSQNEGFTTLFIAMALSILFVYMVLASQFNSFIHPLSVLVALPFSIAGAFVALHLTHQTLNMFSVIGLILLMGIVKKNSILLVDAAIDRITAITKDAEVGDRYTGGKVVKTTNFGAFVELTKGTDGLLHISNVKPGERVGTVEDVLNQGDEIDVTTCSLDQPNRVPPVDHTRTSSRLAWVKLTDGLPPFREIRQEG